MKLNLNCQKCNYKAKNAADYIKHVEKTHPEFHKQLLRATNLAKRLRLGKRKLMGILKRKEKEKVK